ncbi:carboxypeptidase regulatory-like domain-containing protein [Lachnotalea glycerini]|uniref:Carboxypeptidase regulatory-like domain-containing protein n=1 Tax=Lachnotalea glycerini TaxID=1763509 RepID=A0A371JGX8_9FIRM|nr:carboxypeptidase regulatory-like domain-containing protein [Lachnotalea glycerini]
MRNENYIDYVLIRGYVRYRDSTPVKNAVVILERISSDCNKEQQKKRLCYVTHTITDKDGEFNFFVSDRTSYYKIKVFDNHHY